MTMETTRETAVGGAVRDPIVERAATSAHQAVDRVAAKVSPTVERVRAAAAGSADTLNAKLDDIGSLRDEWTESCRSYVRERPMTAIGVAVLAGFLLSRWIRIS
jgi:ElaB/YqjD/DUF883 family membrane-anchored ribosome-binding protein